MCHKFVYIYGAPICMSVCLSVCLYLSIYLSVYLSIYLPYPILSYPILSI